MKFSHKITATISMGLFALACVGGLSYWHAVREEKVRQWVVHSYQVLDRIDALANSIVTAESALRGYGLSASPSYLPSYEEDLNRISSTLKELRQLTADNPTQQYNLDLLEPLIQAKIAQMQAPLKPQRTAALQAAVEATVHGPGQQLMEQIRELFTATRGEEQRLLQQRTATASAAFRTAKVAILAGNALAISLLLVAGLAIRREFGERQRAVADLTRSNSELDAFTYSLAHDLRAPMRHIHGFAELLWQSAHAKLNDEDKRFLQKVLKSSKDMGALVDALLRFAHLGRTELSHSLVNLSELVESVRQQLEPEIQGRALVWHIGDLPEVRGDPALLQQVLMNLLSNAVKYTRKAGAALVEIESRNGHGEITVLVRDNGAGFDMKHAGKLFGVFERLHARDDFEGVGVGLANVRRIIERHGGRVWAEGVPDCGATFYFSLPKRGTSQ